MQKSSSELPPLWDKENVFENLLVRNSSEALSWVNDQNGNVFCVLQSTERHLVCMNMQNHTIAGRAEVSEEDPILSFTAEAPDQMVTLSAHRSSLIRLWNGPELKAISTFKAFHNGPIIHLRLSRLSGVLYSASAGANATLKVWKLSDQVGLKTLRDFGAKMSALKIVQRKDKEAICAGLVDGTVSIWTKDTQDDKVRHLKKHVSPISGLEQQTERLISVGRDGIFVLWDLGDLQCLKVVPTFEEVESSCLINSKCFGDVSDENVMVTGDKKGQIKVWNIHSGKQISKPEWENMALTDLPILSLHGSEKHLMFMQEDVLFKKDLETDSKAVPFCLNSSEVTGLSLIDDRYLIVSGMTSVLRSFDLKNENSLNVVRTADEETVVLTHCRDGTKKFATAGKSHTIHIWNIKDGNKLNRVMTASGHKGHIRAMAMVNKRLLSGDEDGVIKMWKVKSSKDKEENSAKTLHTVLAHEKEVTCIEVDVNKGLIISGSLDKKAKLWDLESLSPVSVLQGHRRGIVSLAFPSQNEDFVATGASDLVIKLWHTKQYNCLKTLEGLAGVPSQIRFISNKELIYTTTDGTLATKEYSMPSEGGQTFEGHSGQIWGLCSVDTETEKRMVTAGADGQIVFWRNNAEQIKEEIAKQKNLQIKQDQMLFNCEQQGNVKKALALAIKLDRPAKAYQLLLSQYENDSLSELLATVSDLNWSRLMDYTYKWNTNSRQCGVAQEVQFYILSRKLSLDDNRFEILTSQGMKMYDEKHFARISNLAAKVAIVDNLLSE